MPLYIYHCEVCGEKKEAIRGINGLGPICCNQEMAKVPTAASLVKIDGLGFPSRRKWMDNWTPDSKPFSTGSKHGERY